MRKLFETFAALLLVGAMLLGIAVIFGLTPEGLGRWPDTNDHPTNWNDAALHP